MTRRQFRLELARKAEFVTKFHLPSAVTRCNGWVLSAMQRNMGSLRPTALVDNVTQKPGRQYGVIA